MKDSLVRAIARKYITCNSLKVEDAHSFNENDVLQSLTMSGFDDVLPMLKEFMFTMKLEKENCANGKRHIRWLLNWSISVMKRKMTRSQPEAFIFGEFH